ncbi:MAG: PEP-CTERM sorting domain-containing protein [Verrucomicrobiota bacterium]
MKKLFFSTLLTLAALAQARSAVLTTIPSAMTQGGMLHVNVTFLDQASGTFSSNVESGTPQMKPLALWSPGNNFDVLSPWYMALDPTQDARQYSNRFGFLVDTGASSLIPSGKSLGIRMLSSTAGLGAYFYNSSGAGTFAPVFQTPGAGHDYVLWNGTMWHAVFTMPASTPYGTPVSANFEFFLADTTAAGAVDYTTAASAAAGYSTTTQTVSWTAIPEPSTWALLLGAAAAGFAVLRRRKSS